MWPLRSAVLGASCGFLLTLALVAPQPAHAIEVECIEASRYKHIYKMFGDDRSRFADFLKVPAARLPSGETCRAALVTGKMLAARHSERESDFTKLLAFVAKNNGWLAHLYLASSGGNIATGLELAQLTRLFWLKTHSPSAKSFEYQVDFVTPTPPADEWLRSAQMTVGSGSGRCASACTFLHVAGIDRVGTMHVHRSRMSRPTDKGAGVDTDRSIFDTVEGLQRAEERILALYREMDAGEDAVRIRKETPTQTLAAATTPRFPRYMADFLRTKCGRDAVEPRGPRADRLRTEQCIATAHEKERLALFARHCRQGCDHAAIRALVKARLEASSPPAARTPQSPTASPRRRIF